MDVKCETSSAFLLLSLAEMNVECIFSQANLNKYPGAFQNNRNSQNSLGFDFSL